MKSQGVMCRAILGFVVGAVCLASATAVRADPPDGITNGLVAYYPFDTSSSDASGRGHDGVMNNGASITPSGRFGGALLLDGTNDHVKVAGSADFHLTNHTISAWVFLDRFPLTALGEECVVDWTAPDWSKGGCGMCIKPGEFWGWYRGGSQSIQACSPAGVFTVASTGSWHHLAYTTGWSNNQARQSLYLDGNLVRSTTNPTFATRPPK